jgi:hypothetical protein
VVFQSGEFQDKLQNDSHQHAHLFTAKLQYFSGDCNKCADSVPCA